MTTKYVGKQGEYLPGIPARNLTDEEWDELSKEERKAAVASGLYVKPDTDNKPVEHKHVVAKEEPTDKKPGG